MNLLYIHMSDCNAVLFLGRSGMRQYMPNKPIKWGFKLWVLATSDSSSPSGAGYVVDFDVHLGSQGVPEEGLTQKVMLELLEPPVSSNLPLPVLGLGYHLYVDKLLPGMVSIFRALL